MAQYLTRKLVYTLLVLVGVIVVVFFLFQGFGDPARLVMGQTGDSTTLANVRKDLALDQPRWKQFMLYLNDVSPLAVHSAEEIESKQLKGFFVGSEGAKVGVKLPYLRRSYQSKKPVTGMLMQALPNTLLLAFTAMLLASIGGIFFGVIAALNKDRPADTAALLITSLGISAPSFFIGIIIAFVFGFVLNHVTGLSMTGSLWEVDAFEGRRLALSNLILPAITLGIRPLAIITQLTRSSMLDVLQQDYIRTAYAKGLTRTVVVYKHALRNAINPVITAITGWFAELLAGAFFVEYIFGWNGIGKLTVDALDQLDFPVVMGSVLLTATFFVIVNLAADVLYRVVDPRIKD